MQLLAHDTWQRIEFARTRPGLKIFETTITQNLLYELRLYREIFPRLPIEIFEAFDEPTNGNDIELIIETSEGYIIAPLQAKIIYSNYRYNSMEHGDQIRNLITYAEGMGGIPLYLLYNYYPDEDFHWHSTICDVRHGKEQFGCSLVNAYYLMENYAYTRVDRLGRAKWAIPHFMDLHPNIALPWFILGCCNFGSQSIDAIINQLVHKSSPDQKRSMKVRSYDRNEFSEIEIGDPWTLKDH